MAGVRGCVRNRAASAVTEASCRPLRDSHACEGPSPPFRTGFGEEATRAHAWPVAPSCMDAAGRTISRFCCGHEEPTLHTGHVSLVCREREVCDAPRRQAGLPGLVLSEDGAIAGRGRLGDEVAV
jgi:hypothetical protein